MQFPELILEFLYLAFASYYLAVGPLVYAFEDFRLSETGVPSFCVFEGRELLEIDTAAAGMYEEFRRKGPGYRTVLRGYLSVLLAKLFRRMALPAPEADGYLDLIAIGEELDGVFGLDLHIVHIDGGA